MVCELDSTHYQTGWSRIDMFTLLTKALISAKFYTHRLLNLQHLLTRNLIAPVKLNYLLGLSFF